MLAVFLAAFLFAFPAYAAAPQYTLDKDKSSLTFVVFINGAPVQGAFNTFDADIRFDPKQLKESVIKVTVDTGSVSVENDDVKKSIAQPEWLSVKQFPQAVFTCKGLTQMPASQDYYGKCDLRLRGKTLPVELNFQMEHFDTATAIAGGYVTLHRIDFGVGQGQWAKDDTVQDNVRVNFRVVAEKK